LCKIPNTKFSYLRQDVRKWGITARPFPDNVEWVSHFDPDKYDMALLHTDQDVVEGVSGKARLFTEVGNHLKDFDIPVVVINHGTPFHPEAYQDVGMTTKQHIKYIREKSKDIIYPIADHIIVNSKQGQAMWDFGDVIYHGMDSEEWPDLPKEPRVVVSMAPAGWSSYYNRPLLTNVKQLVQEKVGQKEGIFHCMVTGEFDSHKAYSEFIGRSLVYFNPTKESPMPRSRTEAMHCGSCVVTTKHHDADTFIENGKNGFVVPDNPEHIANLLVELLTNYKFESKRDVKGRLISEKKKSRYTYDDVISIGQEGKKTAEKLFSADRFRKEWTQTIEKVLKGKGNNVKNKR
jgi:hypothetical protein